MHRIVVLALDDVIAFDLATPVEVLGRVVDEQGDALYDVRVAGPEPSAGAGPMRIEVPHGLDALDDADTVLVPGRYDPTAPIDPAALDAVRRAAGRGARIASICVGALDLAATGLLDGLRATTHWRAAELLAARHPAVDVTPDALFVDNGQILTSAGAAAGIDLCLHLIGRDFGAAVAADAARAAVVPLTREAGQAQYVKDDTLGATSLTAALRWIDAHAAEPITVADIAAAASVSTRTLNRRFLAELKLPPTRWLIRARVRIAQRLLETTDLGVDQVAHESGLGSASNLREHFTRVVGTTPGRYRRALTVAG
jgi:transcriptional regulator GlxA family with amidase domain